MSNRHPLLVPALLIAILAVSTASIFIRFAQAEAPALAIAAWRLTFASLLLAPVTLRRHRQALHALSRRDLALALLSGLFLAAHFATWISSLAYTTVASSVVLVSTSPLWVALLSPLFLKEKLPRTLWVGLTLTILGGVFIGMNDACSLQGGALRCPSLAAFLQGRAAWGNFLALAGAWAVSGYLMIGRRLREKTDLIPYIFTVYSMAALVLLLIALVSGIPLLGYSTRTFVWLLLLALVPQLIGHSTYNWALRYLPAAFVAVTTLGEPIGSTILAYFILQEIPGALQLLGGALILAGIYITSQASANSSA